VSGPDLADPAAQRVARLLALALGIAVICNGAGTYLKRTGLLEPDSYRAYWAIHCWVMEQPPAEPAEPQCARYSSPAEIANHAQPDPGDPRSVSNYIYKTAAAERPLKLLKDVFWIVLIGAGLGKVAWQEVRPANWRRLWPISALAVYSVVMFLLSIPINGALIAVAGLRSFLFLFSALLCRWLIPHMAVFANLAGALLVIQGLLVPFELFRGIHLFHEWSAWSLASRVAGTLVQPNTMGVFAVAALAFYYSFSISRRCLAALVLVSLGLVLLSGSGTGLVCAALGLLLIARRRVNKQWRTAATSAGALAVAAALLMLPNLTGRENIFDSIGTSRGRVAVLHSALFERGAAEVLFGSGLGVNTNTALSLATPGSREGMHPSGPIAHAPTDSTLTGLVIQIGLLGTLMFYGALLWAASRDVRARPFYLVAALCSLTINLTELFPVNVLLGLALAHSAWNSADRQRAASS